MAMAFDCTWGGFCLKFPGILLFMHLLSSMAVAQSPPGVLDSRLETQVASVPSSGYDTTYSRTLVLELSDSLNVQGVEVQVRELGPTKLLLDTTYAISAQGTPLTLTGKELSIPLGESSGGKHMRYKAVVLGAANERSEPYIVEK